MNFDATNIDPNDNQDANFSPIPAGWYEMTIVGAEAQHGKKANVGEMLKLTLAVDANAHPEYAGRQVWDYLCVNHENSQPRQIAQRKLSAICHAIGVTAFDHESALLGGRIQAKLKIRPAGNGYDANNDVGSYKPVDEQFALPEPVPPPAQRQARPGGWHR